VLDFIYHKCYNGNIALYSKIKQKSWSAMKNYTNRKRKKNRVWQTIIVLALVAFGGFLIWNYFIRPEKPTTPDNQAVSNSDKDTTTKLDEATKPISDDNTQDEQNPKDDGKTPIQYDGDKPSAAQNFTGFITNKNVNQSTNQLTIRLTIDQLVQPAGTCTLKLTSTTSSAIVTKTVPTIDNPSSSSCQGFDIPLSELSSGKWQINVQIKNNNKSGEIDGGEIDIP
jgi:cytoskeletal protein RodZ